MKTKRTYEEEALRLSKAIDIAIESFQKYPPEFATAENTIHFIKSYSEWKEMALHPEPQYRKIASLKYLVEAVFTSFQEGSGEYVEYFWSEIEKQDLGYVRSDMLRKILERGKIKNHIEYEYITDIIVIAQQENRITEEEARQLSMMIGQFEGN